MRVAIVGGKLQGVEAAYLARKAGWQTVLLDHAAQPVASILCDTWLQVDVCTLDERAKVWTEVDLVIPALENQVALAALRQLAPALPCPIAFDFAANQLSCSKSKSHGLFAELGLTMPRPYPDCGFPVLIKPDSASGSHGVTILADEAACVRQFGSHALAPGWVGQEFVSGPSYSLEVIGRDGGYLTPQITGIHMDAGYDCKAVTAPVAISAPLAAQLQQITRDLASALDLSGIMDVEVIAQDDRLFLLEIDARLPSQTPIAVYWSTGINMLELLAEVFLPDFRPRMTEGGPQLYTRLEHLAVDSGVLTLAGEHLMASASPLQIKAHFFGAQEALTDYEPGRDRWCATLIHTGVSWDEVEEKRSVTLAAIKAECGIEQVFDSVPGQPS